MLLREPDWRARWNWDGRGDLDGHSDGPTDYSVSLLLELEINCWRRKEEQRGFGLAFCLDVDGSRCFIRKKEIRMSKCELCDRDSSDLRIGGIDFFSGGLLLRQREDQLSCCPRFPNSFQSSLANPEGKQQVFCSILSNSKQSLRCRTAFASRMISVN